MEQLRDKVAKFRIARRLRQIEDQNLGDVKSVGDGVLELRIDDGAGYRVYCGRYAETWVVLLLAVIRVPRTKTLFAPNNSGRSGSGGRNEESCWCCLVSRF